MSLAAQLILQDVLCPPSRVSMKDLQSRYFLPCRLSNYVKLSASTSRGLNEDAASQEQQVNLGIHYLKQTAASETNTNPKRFVDVVYVNHGFGASSLSWLPTLPRLVDRLGALSLIHI